MVEKCGIVIPWTYFPTKDLFALVQLAENLGYDSAWVAEAWGRDAFTVLGALTQKTEKINLATGIVNLFSRSPATLAMSAASLQDLTGGRFFLGLGLSGPIVIQDWHGISFENPLQRTREYIEIIRKVLAGEQVNHDGEIYNLKRFKMAFPAPEKKIPIYIASLGPKNVELTGELADGWMPINLPVAQIPKAMKWLKAGAEKVGKDVDDMDIASYIVACTHSGENEEEVVNLCKRQVAFYVGGMGTYYSSSLKRLGFEEEAKAIQKAWLSGDRRQAAAEITSELLDAIAVVGSENQCRKKLQEMRRAGIKTPIIALPYGCTQEMALDTLQTFASDT